MTGIIHTGEYRQWIVSIKQRIQASQFNAAVAVNRELLELYWYLGEQILEKQQNSHRLEVDGEEFLAMRLV